MQGTCSGWLRSILSGITLALLFACRAFAADPPADRPPNILVIMTDEHNASVLGCYGNPIVQTPNLDRLAARGVIFTAAYTNSPLCVPSRLAFTAGKYASRVGAWNNNCWLPTADYPSIARRMNAAGYASYLCGKMHYDRTCRYGFTEIGGNMNDAFMVGTGQRRAADDLTGKGLSGRFRQFRAGDNSNLLNHDRRVTAGAVEFLSHRKPDEKPFFLLVGYLAPHFPLIVPEAYWNHYRGKVAGPKLPAGFLDTLPLNYRHLRAGFRVSDVPDDTITKGRELYYGLTEWMDNEVGHTLRALEASGLAENTIVIYTADHGENMGEHGLWWKNAMYESAARVPLIVSWPRRWSGGQRRESVCTLVDVVSTIAELGHADAPDDWNGASLCRVLDDPNAVWRNTAVSEYYAHNIASGFVMYRAGPFKYVYHTPPDGQHPAERELYDLRSDPGEFHNLAADAEQQQRIERMHAAMIKEVGEDPDQTELRCRADLAKGYGRRNAARRRQQPAGENE